MLTRFFDWKTGGLALTSGYGWMPTKTGMIKQLVVPVFYFDSGDKFIDSVKLCVPCGLKILTTERH
jgi:hypothetical protein